MPTPRLVLAVLLLLTINVAAGNVTLTCTVESSYTVDTTSSISVNFNFESIAPAIFIAPWSVTTGLYVRIRYTTSDYNTYLYGVVHSAQWDRPLEFKVTLNHYVPDQRWRIDRYRCVYNRSGNVEVRYYEVVAQKPQRMTTTITFKVPATAARYSNSTSVKVSKPLRGGYCSAPPTVESWPNCPAFRAENNTASVYYPESWRAIQVNGRRPGDIVSAYGVNATIPKPWEYSLYPENVETFSFVRIDDSDVYEPKNASGVPVSSSVYFHAVGMPKRWGSVGAAGARAPLYVAKLVLSRRPPETFCRPPACVVLAWKNLTMQCNSLVTDEQYVALVAVRSGITMTARTFFMTEEEEGYLGAKIYVPLGSIIVPVVGARWTSGVPDVSVYLAETPYPRMMFPALTYYEELGAKGKLNGPFRTSIWTRSKIAVAVDKDAPVIVLGFYSRPIPFYDYPTTTITWDVNVYLCNYMTKGVRLSAPIWITEGLRRNHPYISGGRYIDLLYLLYFEATTYYWGGGGPDLYGVVSVRTERRYEHTTLDPAGERKLYHVTGIRPTDVGTLDIRSAPQTIDGGGGGGTDTVSLWLVALVPTTACRTMFCTSLSPELLGPLPPFPGDRALPNMGYSFMLMYIGEAGRRRVKVYVEDGYVISSGPPINVSRARNYKLVEIDKEWRPFEAVVVGPGWWVPYRRLGPCETIPVRASSIYATPDRTGPVRIIVEDNGRNSTYVFHVTNDVEYRILTRTPAPESITATPFNMTVYVTLGGVPYYHALYGYGEGGRLSPPACNSTRFDNHRTSRLFISGDFWGSFGLAHMPLRPVNIQYIYVRPRLELVDPWRGLVRVGADGPVAGFAFYAQRGGTWVKIGETRGSCVLINASRIFPWDPILVLPLVEQELAARPGDMVTIWRPATSLLFKTWADVVGYPKGARSVLDVVRTC
jgi:hypothetical protein